ncbi:MAG TPA: sigma-54-dependent Fis family transcriptional regulator [Pelagibacterium sp.]|nr:sigma-54-dependent Fis family transcriptional regulator [Magnetovibrio sp.]HBT41776.1 sigma-54-dependent Fis family transcriptional regulator [Rhodospirillaceae bacterium]HCO55858.1 sigma-54-dependent Fis family transcriptional regulator [Pelagibacterium sp.]|tara:strand:+ start:1467 stop:2813 length:1347 start_codon:yes stop_codon:yes gene_type:complete
MRLLIIGTLGGQIGAASQIAMQKGAKVQQAETVDRALDQLRSGQGADLIMIDVHADIARLVSSLESERIALPVIACGVGNDSQAAVRAIKAGAKEYIPLPPDAELIAAVLHAVSEEPSTIVYNDPGMADVIKMADQIAPSEASVLITGASGTGKEMMARHLHAKSRRKDKTFVAVNCAAIPENLLESELFGHEKGAFTGAVSRRVGKFEEADGGTLLLDEVSEMDPRLQAKLLRALQEREIDRVGGAKPVKVDVRIIATSNRNLQEEVAKGSFREDLYFRLNVVNLVMPSLSRREQDIPLLARHFVKKYSEANHIDERPISEGAMSRLMAHNWPGNVRELENAIHRAVILATGSEIGPETIMVSGTQGAPASGISDADMETAALVGRTVADVERDLIIDTLHHCLGNRTHAANILGISIRTLRNKLRQYSQEGFAVPQPGEAGAAPAP